MKNKFKHIIALFLVIVMSFQMAAFVAADEAADAATEEVVEEAYVIKNMREFEILNALGIFSIYDTKNFTGDKTVTREEAAAIAGRMVGLVKGYSMEGKVMPFTDVKDTDIFAYEIYHMNNLGIMTGYAGEFNPGGIITEEQFVKVVVEALGYGAEAQSMGGYPHGYTITAGKYGMLNEVTYGGAVPLTQDVAVQIIYNCINIETPKVISVEDGGFMTTVGKTIMSQYLNVARSHGVVMRNEDTLLGVGTSSKRGTVQIGDTFFYTGTTNAEDYIGYNVEFFYKKTAEDDLGTILYIAPWQNEVTHVEAEDVGGYANFEYTIFAGNTHKKIKIPRTAKVLYNGVGIDKGFNKFVPEIGHVDFIDNDEDGEIDVVLIVSYALYDIKANNISEEVLTTEDNQKLTYKDTSWNVVDKEGKALSGAMVAGGTVLLLAVSENKKVINGFQVYDYVEGTVESMYTEGTVKHVIINGVDYRASSYVTGIIGTTVKLTNKVGFYVYNDILLVKSYPSSSLTDSVGYLIEAGKTTGFNGKTFLRMLLQTGEVAIVDVNEKAKLVCYGRPEVNAEDFVANLSYELKMYASGDADGSPSEESLTVVRQPVVYRMNENGEITYLEIAAGHNYENRIDALEDTDGFQLIDFIRGPFTRFNGYVRNIANAGNDSLHILSRGAWIIGVPAPSDWQNFEGYQIINIADAGLSLKDQDRDTRVNPWRLYRTGNDMTGANIVVTTNLLESAGGSARFVVEKIGESVTDDGVPCYMISGKTLGLGDVSVKTADKTVVDSMSTYTVTEGDLISCSLNAENLCTKISINYDKETTSVVSQPASYLMVGDYILGGTAIMQRQELLSFYSGKITSVADLDMYNCRMIDTGLFNIMMYDSTLDRAPTRLVKASEGDIVTYVNNPAAASKLFAVYRDGGPSLLVIYK